LRLFATPCAPCRCIIDAELVGCDADGVPDFHALTTGNNHGCCAFCFDLMMVDGKDVRAEPLEQRRERLQLLLARADGDLLRLSESFDDPHKLLEAAVRLASKASCQSGATRLTGRGRTRAGSR
jgi:bifunctional non-homologous end joining protein LigD